MDHIFQEYFLSDEWDNNTFVRSIKRSLNVEEFLTYRRMYKNESVQLDEWKMFRSLNIKARQLKVKGNANIVLE